MSVKARTASDIEFESKIVWLSNIDAIPYVRECFNTWHHRAKTGKLYAKELMLTSTLWK